MSTTIHKYVLPAIPGEHRRHLLPEGAVVLSAHAQGGDVAIWAAVDVSRPLLLRCFALVMTGSDVPDDLAFIGTALLDEGDFVLHVFEVME